MLGVDADSLRSSIFSIAYGNDADVEALGIFSEATNSTFNKATEKNIIEVLAIFARYF